MARRLRCLIDDSWGSRSYRPWSLQPSLRLTRTRVAARGGQQWQIAGAFPQSEPGPLERQAKPVTPENPIPRRTRLVRPPYPSEAAVVGARASVTLRVTVDHLGTVAEVRTVGAPVLGAMSPPSPADERAFTAGLSRAHSIGEGCGGAVALRASGRRAHCVQRGHWVHVAGRRRGDLTESAGRRLAPRDADSPAGRTPPATKVKHVTPVYPAAAREAKIAGIVILEVDIGADGRIVEARGRCARSQSWIDAALEAVKQWEYTPLRSQRRADAGNDDGDDPVLAAVIVSLSSP